MDIPASTSSPVCSPPLVGHDVIVLWPRPPPPDERQGPMEPPPPERPQEHEQAPLMIPPNPHPPAAFVPNMPPSSISAMPPRPCPRPPHPPPRSNAPNSLFFKTRLCQKFSAMECCPYGDACNFAHGRQDLRQPPPNWQEIAKAQRTRICRKFYAGEVCPYGERCSFLHVGQGPAASTAPPPGGNAGGLRPGSGSVGGSHESKQNLPMLWNSKPCHNWGSTSRQSNEEGSIFAHGSAELKNPPLNMENSEMAPRSTLSTSANNNMVTASQHTTRKGFPNLERIKKLNHIYADWIE